MSERSGRPATITVTGATGHVGEALVESLLQRGLAVRAVGRSAERLSELTRKGAEPRAGDAADPEFLAEAFRGADAVFAMLPPHYDVPDPRGDQRRLATATVEGLKRAGVPRAVALSSIGASLSSGTGPIAGLHEFEEMLKAAPSLSTVALRAAYFMENHLSSIHLIKTAGINGGPIKAGVALPMVATRDIAAAAAELLAAPTFQGYAVREVLGPRDLTFPEVTKTLGAAIGKPDLPYVEFPYADFKKALVGAGFSESVADQFVEMNDALNDGRIQKTLARTAASTTPTTLEEFARNVFAPAFQA